MGRLSSIVAMNVYVLQIVTYNEFFLKTNDATKSPFTNQIGMETSVRKEIIAYK